ESGLDESSGQCPRRRPEGRSRAGERNSKPPVRHRAHCRRRSWNPSSDPGADFRSFLHDQAAGRRDRPGPAHRSGAGEAAQRRDRVPIRAWPYRVQGLVADHPQNARRRCAALRRLARVTKPVILAVDDDREVLAAIERDLRKQYRKYRVLSAASPREALGSARQFHGRGVPVALFIVDQRMPELTGTELLVELKKLHPDAKRVLLTAYADTEAAIAAINEVGLNHYLMKPWDPPEERLYPILDDLLADWMSGARPPF